VSVPTYEYECQACHRRVEAVQRFSDPALTTCESCGGELRKVFSAVGIVFKGSGFYKNDSRTSSGASTKSDSPATPVPAATSSESSGATTPAAPAAASAPSASTSSTD
jgi:putative FmdB family regulatory protein